MNDIEAIERATVAAVAPDHTEAFDGWLIALGQGAIRRGKSATPLSHDGASGPASIPAIEAAYQARGIAPAFRIGDVAGLAPIRTVLAERGYLAEQPTLVMCGTADQMARVAPTPAKVAMHPDPSWIEVFAGEGFDPAEGAERLAALSRSPQALYASVVEGDQTLAVGVAALGHGWASVHGMRTALAHRGRGLARQVLAGLASAVRAEGVERVFLQVEEDNAPARALYAAAGFTPRWLYRYWQVPA